MPLTDLDMGIEKTETLPIGEAINSTMKLTQVKKSFWYIMNYFEHEQLWFLTWKQVATRIKIESVIPVGGTMNLNELLRNINSPDTILMKLEQNIHLEQEAPNADTRSNTAGKESW